MLKPVRLLWFGEVSTAAFRRLCVETKAVLRAPAASNQPPSGGCVLKQKGGYMDEDRLRTAAFRRLCVETDARSNPKAKQMQPPSGGCVLKQRRNETPDYQHSQPPSGGCVLKHYPQPVFNFHPPAAFRRLCVETFSAAWSASAPHPAAFRRLCVETPMAGCPSTSRSSRLQAAVC